MSLLLFLKRPAMARDNTKRVADNMERPPTDRQPATQHRTFEVLLISVTGDKATATLSLTQKSL